MKKVNPRFRRRSASLDGGFFLPGDAVDPAYRNIRDKLTGPAPEARAFIEALWLRYRGLEDSNFLTDARTHFLERFWEMYLAVTFMERGLKPSRKGCVGPEFWCSYGERKIWVEAVAPGPGDGADRVEGPERGVVTDVPEEKILLRFTHALREKRERYLAAQAKGIVSDQDCYVLAVNSKGIPHGSYGALPFFLKALLPIGNRTLKIDQATAKITDSWYAPRETIMKACGSPVSTTAFLDRHFAFVSAVVHSSVDYVNRPAELGADFMILYNPLARPLEQSVFQWCEQCLYNDGELRIEPGSRT